MWGKTRTFGVVVVAVGAMVASSKFESLGWFSQFLLSHKIKCTSAAVVWAMCVCCKRIMTHVYRSVSPLPPTERTIKLLRKRKGEQSEGIIFQFFPQMKGNIAWLNLGDYPTPVDKVILRRGSYGEEIEIFVKREDRASPVYGGNKIRTLEFQLASAIEGLSKGAAVVAVGGPGSNQCVATAALCHLLNVPSRVLPAGSERASFDNSLNLLSMMSFPAWVGPLWIRGRLRAFMDVKKIDKLLPPGGANPTGALGHVGAVLELVDQIKQGCLPQPAHIFLPLGSSCTTSGILAGIALARTMRIGFNKEKLFRLHAVVIHHAAAWVPFLVRLFIKKLVTDTLTLLAELGGPDARGEIDHLIKTSLIIHCSHAGKYGGWTPKGEDAKRVFDEADIQTLPTNDERSNKSIQQASPPPKMWMCSCFSSKAGAAMLDFLKQNSDREQLGPVMFWATKSLVQPQGDIDAWKVAEACPAKAKRWLKHGQVEHSSDFVHKMTRVEKMSELA